MISLRAGDTPAPGRGARGGCRGPAEGDLRRNYHDDVVVFSGCGIHRGHDGVRRTASILHHYLGDGSGYEISNRLVDQDAAFIAWLATRPGRRAHDGADSFLIRDGRIAVQTIHYSVVRDAEIS